MKKFFYLLVLVTIISVLYGLNLIQDSLEASTTTGTIAIQGAVRDLDELHVSDEFITTIPSASELITWYYNVEPNSEIINSIQNQLDLIPDKLLLDFVNMRGTIVVIDSNEYFITSNADFNFGSDWTITAQTDTYYNEENKPVYSEIMILDNTEDINDSLCHEFGHLLYAELYGKNDFVLNGRKNNTKDYRNYIKELKDTEYIAHSDREYFAEVFADWCRNTDYTKHEDLLQMNEIVSEYLAN